VTLKPDSGPVAALAKRKGADIYLFAVAMSGQQSWATLKLDDASINYDVEVLDEGRRMRKTTAIQDKFDAYQVHLYKLSPAK
jgi:hypothetical protein